MPLTSLSLWIWPAVSETLVLNETKPTKRSQIKICEKRKTWNVQFRFMPNAFRIPKPIQKSSKCVWMFRNTGANAVAKNQTRLAYEDKRDLYCITRVIQCVTKQILVAFYSHSFNFSQVPTMTNYMYFAKVYKLINKLHFCEYFNISENISKFTNGTWATADRASFPRGSRTGVPTPIATTLDVGVRDHS